MADKPTVEAHYTIPEGSSGKQAADEFAAHARASLSARGAKVGDGSAISWRQVGDEVVFSATV